jgi:transposase InsO family protein
MNHQDVLDRLAELFVDRGVPEYIRSDNGSEFTAQAVRDWLKAVGVRTLYIEPGRAPGRMDMWRASTEN